jgi:16S rRNA (guanine527-N7)-methyltransferase
MPLVPTDADRQRALTLTPVSSETLERLDRFVALLLNWQQRTNLIAPSTIPTIWTRHIADSLQLLDVAPDARTWVDLGSGAGFPGLVLASALAGVPKANVHLVESNGKKAAFLREAIRVAACPAVVHHMRIERFLDGFAGPVDVVTARALASLKTLIDQSVRLISQGAVGVFPKGQDADAEVAETAKYWNLKHSLIASRTESRATILVIHSAERRKVNRTSPAP